MQMLLRRWVLPVWLLGQSRWDFYSTIKVWKATSWGRVVRSKRESPNFFNGLCAPLKLQDLKTLSKHDTDILLVSYYIKKLFTQCVIANLPCQSDFRITIERNLPMCVCMIVFPEWFNWGMSIHPKNGCHHSMDWGPRLNKKEKVRYTLSFISPSFLTMDNVWPTCLILQPPCGLYPETGRWNKLWLLSAVFTATRKAANAYGHCGLYCPGKSTLGTRRGGILARVLLAGVTGSPLLPHFFSASEWDLWN